MPTIWGRLNRIEEDLHGTPWVEIKAFLSTRTTIRVRALVGSRTLIARGIERVDLSSLSTGEFVEVSYNRSHDGFMEAETIYVRPDRVAVA
jgi:hypothetical protein